MILVEEKKLEEVLQLSKLIYNKDKNEILKRLKSVYNYDEVYYFDKKSHLLINDNILKSIVSKILSRYTLVDLQFFIALKNKEIVIVFKGSKEFVDWLTNTTKNLSSHKNFENAVHKGFYESFDVFRRTLNSNKNLQDKNIDFKNNQKHINENYSITLAGHSLGGAIATLAGCHLVDIGIEKKNLQVFTFGAPPVAKKSFCEYYTNKIDLIRVVNKNDLVPKLSYNKLKHLGQELVFDVKDFNAHKIVSYEKAIKNFN